MCVQGFLALVSGPLLSSKLFRGRELALSEGRAGMRVIGFTGASHTYPGHADKLTDAGAETVIARMMDLPAVVAALSDWGGIS